MFLTEIDSHDQTLWQILTEKTYLTFLQTAAFQIERTFFIGHIIVIASHQGLYIVSIQNFSVVIPL